VTLPRGWRSAAIGLAVVAVVVGAAAVRVISEGRAELASSEAAWATGDVAGATVHARAAARAYVPFAPHVASAYSRLRFIAKDCEGRGDVESALFAWRAVRAAAIGSRSFLTAHDRQRQAADAAIARLSSSSRGAPAEVAGEDAVTKVTSDREPGTAGWGLLLFAGVVLWIVAALRITSGAAITSAADSPERKALDLRELGMPIALASIGLVAVWVALFLA
jgi:hypothetical protein